MSDLDLEAVKTNLNLLRDAHYTHEYNNATRLLADDVPALVAEVERLRAAHALVRELAEYYDHIGSAPTPEQIRDALDGVR